MGIEIKRLGAAVGAEITGIDLADDIGDNLFRQVHQAFMDHTVLVFRDQDLEPDAQVAFSRRFGPSERHVLKQFARPDNPDVFLISNLKEKGKPKGAIRAGQFWHSDLSYMACPTLASFLHAREVPDRGGDTLFAGMAAAYEALSEKMKAMVSGLKAVHDYTKIYETYFSRFPDRPGLTAEEIAKVPPVEHPVVRAHPETGRKALFVNPGFTRRIVGLSFEESQSVLDFLFDHAVRPEFVYRHAWRAGDLVMWDNRGSVHQALADYDMDEARHMHRTSVAGDAPV